MSKPQTIKQWTVQGTGSFDNWKLDHNAAVPEVGAHDVLVKLHAASLNYRDLIIPLGKYPFPIKDGVVPGSDGAGEVIATGDKVTRFKKGDKVVSSFCVGLQAGSHSHKTVAQGLGGVPDGVLREIGVFSEEDLAMMPKSLSYIEAATLPCAAVTAFNALYGLKRLLPGETVLVQGTGGVSIFGLQLAKAAGATVIATTSSKEKEDRLKSMGADHVINYKETPNWGEKAKELSYRGEGCQHIIEVGGPGTIAQSLKAVKIDGIISIIGFVAGGDDAKEPSYLDCLTNLCTVRGLMVGSRTMLEETIAAIDANKIKPAVDQKVFKLEQLKEAGQYQLDQKHFGKVCIEIN